MPGLLVCSGVLCFMPDSSSQSDSSQSHGSPLSSCRRRLSLRLAVLPNVSDAEEEEEEETVNGFFLICFSAAAGMLKTAKSAESTKKKEVAGSF